MSKNLYAEILFDYLIAHYENTILQVNKTKELLNEFESNDDEKAREFNDYYQSLVENKKIIETLVDHYYNHLINKIKSDEKFKGVNAEDLDEIVVQSARLSSRNHDAQYFAKLEFLDNYFDEDELRNNNVFKDHFRCASYV